MRLLIQPGDGIKPLVKAIKKAKKSVEILIFRFDHTELEKALVEAVERGVFVHALIAFTNRGGERNLRKLETHFLEKGITVARTAGDLVRYHGKMMIVDRRELHLLGFNFTHLDTDHSRSFGVVTRNPKIVQEAVNLFEADCQRQPYTAGSSKFLVSPVNARKELAAFIKGAKKQLLIYDLKATDRAFTRLLRQKCEEGLDIRIIGGSSARGVEVRHLERLRLHARIILRDGTQTFLGSQSLRQLELDARREIGIIFRDSKIVKTLRRQFEEDWKASEAAKIVQLEERALPVAKAAKKVAKVVSKHLEAEPVVKRLAKVIKTNGKDQKKIEEALRVVVKDAVKDQVHEATKETVRSLVDEAAG